MEADSCDELVFDGVEAVERGLDGEGESAGADLVEQVASERSPVSVSVSVATVRRRLPPS
jgi:hypothetical protein